MDRIAIIEKLKFDKIYKSLMFNTTRIWLISKFQRLINRKHKAINC